MIGQIPRMAGSHRWRLERHGCSLTAANMIRKGMMARGEPRREHPSLRVKVSAWMGACRQEGQCAAATEMGTAADSESQGTNNTDDVDKTS